MICSTCGMVDNDIAIHGYNIMAIKKNLEGYVKQNKRDFDAKEVIGTYKQYQLDKKDKRKSGKSQQNILHRMLRKTRDDFSYKENIMKQRISIFVHLKNRIQVMILQILDKITT